jgi:cyanobactin maturation PatA/PatG family protease
VDVINPFVATMKTGFSNVSPLLDLRPLWAESLGDPGICIAVLDGPVDQSHPCFDGASFTQLQTLISSVADQGSATQHGTHVTSIIFGQHSGPIHGIAPGCRGLIIPVFKDGLGGDLAPCSQIDLARAIEQAVLGGANIINISGGQLTASGNADPLLVKAIRLCASKNVLIVAAVGNDGCECLHVPAAIESVLAVGAMDDQGNPIGFSNWGEAYKTQGILAPGESILGAIPGSRTAPKTGTSFATPIVCGIAALLLSIQLKQGEKPDPHAIRDAILKSALPCHPQQGLDNRRCLVGRLNIQGVQTLIMKGGKQMVSDQKLEESMIETSEVSNTEQEFTNQQPEVQLLPDNAESLIQIPLVGVQAAAVANPEPQSTIRSKRGTSMSTIPNRVVAASVNPSECAACAAGAGGQLQLVYALGELGTDFGTEARRDSFMQGMAPNQTLLNYLQQNRYTAESLIWTLNLDATPIYAILPAGSYASTVYDRLIDFLADEDIERVSVPGVIGGSIRLLSGQEVPVITPDIRGMYSWSVPALIDTLVANAPAAQELEQENVTSKIREYLERIYYEYRNLGITPEDRALNFSATNAFQVVQVMASAGTGDYGLDEITVEKSPVCRPDSDCYDVKLRFFNMDDNRRAARIYRFTLDVSDVLPVTIGTMRSWSEGS